MITLSIYFCCMCGLGLLGPMKGNLNATAHNDRYSCSQASKSVGQPLQKSGGTSLHEVTIKADTVLEACRVFSCCLTGEVVCSHVKVCT